MLVLRAVVVGIGISDELLPVYIEIQNRLVCLRMLCCCSLSLHLSLSCTVKAQHANSTTPHPL